jgi:hypothetical protein
MPPKLRDLRKGLANLITKTAANYLVGLNLLDETAWLVIPAKACQGRNPGSWKFRHEVA